MEMELEARLRQKGGSSLVKALLRNRFAKARMEKIAERFPDMLDVPIMKYPPFSEAPGTSNKPPEFSIDEDLPAGIDKKRVEEYSLALRNLADDYRLQCDWIIERLHSQIRHLIDPRYRILNIATSTTLVIDYFKLDVPIAPDTRKKDVLRHFEKEWQRIRANPKLRQRVKPPQNFDLAVEWLSRRLFYGYTGEQMVRLFPDSKSYLPSDINRAIKKAAKFLGVKLPPGRPRKAKKR